MWFRDDDADIDPIDAMRGVIWGCLLGLVCWAMAFLAVVSIWG